MSKPTAAGVVKVAKSYVGYKEKASNANLDSFSGNAGSANWTKFNKKMHELQSSNMDFPAAWCDAFVDYCVLEASDWDVADAKYALCGDFDDYTVRSADLYKQAGRFDKSPKVGDQIFFENSAGINHTGIVVDVSTTLVSTVEGNSGNAVRKHTYLKDSPKIAGYGHPRYGDGSGAVTPSTPSKPSGSLAVDGKCGPATVKKWQQVMGTTADGVIGGQSRASKKNHQSINAIKYASDKHGSDLIRAVQKKLKVSQDGLLGPNTIKALQKHLGVKADGYFGPNTTKALQRELNAGTF